MSRKITIFFLVLLLVVVGLTTYRVIINKEKDTKNKPNNSLGGKSGVSVYGIVATGEYFADFLMLTGTIEANEIIDLRSEISGVIENINFSEGSLVNQGQLLVKINDAELRAQLSQAKTRVGLASENERRAKLLLAKEAISQEEYDIASADFRTANSQIELINAQLRKTVILAPFSGRIGLRQVSKGSYVTPNDIISQLVDSDKIKVQFSVPEKYSSLVKVGTTIDFSVQGVKEIFKASIYAMDPLIDPITRTLTVRAIANNSKSLLIPGAFANVNLPLEDVQNAILIPTEALIPIQNGKKVFVQKNGKAKEIIVETGARTDSSILVTEGLQIGDTVLTSGVMSLREGSAVNVILK